MNEDSKNIFLLTKELRKVCKQVSALLLSADGLMGEKGWESYSNTCIRYTSATISAPDGWIPYDVYRFYINDDNPTKLLFITVLLDDRGWSGYEQEEALITAGCFDYGDNEVGNNWYYQWHRWHEYMPGENDGTICSVDPAEEWPEEEYPFNNVITLGLPLSEINNVNDLFSKVVGPLIEAAENED